jgi:RND family efflux transporter MFP subunit
MSTTALRALRRWGPATAIGVVIGLLGRSALVRRAELGPDVAAAQSPAGSAPLAVDAGAIPVVGVVVAREAADLAPTVGGKVASVDVRLGDAVEKGALLATLDGTLKHQEALIARAVVEVQQADEAMIQEERAAAEERRTRFEPMVSLGLTSKEEYQTYAHAAAAASLKERESHAAIRAKRAELGKISTERKLLEVRAPFAGIVAARYIDPGATVTATTPLVRVVASGEPVLRFAVPEESASRVHVGETLRVRPRGSDEDTSAVV